MQIKTWYFPSMSALIFIPTLMVILMDDMGRGRQEQRFGVVAQQEPIFELPVQLVGFPVIILAVRFSNFVKKLSYSLNPQTYQPSKTARSRRSSQWQNMGEPADLSNISHEAIDIAVAEKRILAEFGPKVCVIEEPCRLHAARRKAMGGASEQPDWNDIVRNYKSQSSGMKQWYLLSVFLGDVIRDVSLCKKLAKRLSCERDQKPFIRD